MMFKFVKAIFAYVMMVVVATSLCACGGGGEDEDADTSSSSTYSFKGSLASPTYALIKLQLKLNGTVSETVTLSVGAKSFAFLTQAKAGTNYEVVITQQPQNPTSTCSLSSASGTLSAHVVVSVSCPSIASLTLASTKTTVLSGSTLPLKATAVFSDGQQSDVTSNVIWKTADATIATVSSGTVTGVAAGTVAIQATLAGQSASKNITVSGATLSSVSVSPYNPKIGLGSVQNFKLTGTYSDGSTLNLTSQATWTSSSAAVAEVNTATAGQIAAKATGTATITGSYGGKSANVTVQVTSATLSSLEVSPAIKTIAKSNVAQYVATGLYSDNTVRDISDLVTWSVDAPAKASVNSTGLVTGLDVGSVTVKAELSTFNDTALLTITGTSLTSIDIQNAPTTLPTGFSTTLKAIGNYSDGTTQDITSDVLWSSNDESLLSVSNDSPTNGLIHGLAAGSVVVSADFAGISATKTVPVASVALSSITMSPGSLLIPLGVHLNWTALGTFVDGTQLDITSQVYWNSSAPLYAVMSNVEGSYGLMTSIYSGTGTVSFNVTATYGAVSAIAGMIITPTTLSSLVLRPATITMKTAKTISMKAYGKFSDGGASDLTTAVKWASTARAIASISNSIQTPGLLSSLSEGSATLSATLGAVSANTTVTVSNSATEGSTNDGVGLTGTYHNNKTLSSSKGSRIDANIDFNWAQGNAPLGVGDNFSIHWTGKIKAKYSQTYTFCTRSDDGVRLKVNGTFVVNNWTDHAETENCGTIALTAGTSYPIELDFYESGGSAVVRLFWQSTSQAKEIVPQAYLYPY